MYNLFVITYAVLWAAENGIVEGYDGRFDPNANITRQDLAVIMLRYLNYTGTVLPVTQQWIIFADEALIAEYASDAVQTMYKLGVIRGVEENTIDPRGNANRSQTAAMLNRLFALLERAS